jgi:hypothetical protein
MENNKQLWFKRKRYGWGWTPASWQGWVTILVYMALVILNAVRTVHDPSFVPFVLQTIALSIVLLFISMIKGEKPRWQWGDNEEK